LGIACTIIIEKDTDSKCSHIAWYEYRLRCIELIVERYNVGKGKL